jgi:hypothetical protein
MICCQLIQLWRAIVHPLLFKLLTCFYGWCDTIACDCVIYAFVDRAYTTNACGELKYVWYINYHLNVKPTYFEWQLFMQQNPTIYLYIIITFILFIYKLVTETLKFMAWLFIRCIYVNIFKKVVEHKELQQVYPKENQKTRVESVYHRSVNNLRWIDLSKDYWHSILKT